MEHVYSFSTAQFGLTVQGIHLLRNGFNYKTIDFKDISAIEIRTGMDMRNWLWVLIVGVALTAYAVFDIGKIVWLFNDENTSKIYVQRLVIPIFPLLLGIYSMVIALRKTKIMVIKSNGKLYYLSLRELVKAKQLPVFLDEVREIHGVRIID